jgi:DNA polymerase III delta subunit
MPAADPIARVLSPLLEAIAAHSAPPVVLIAGDLVLAEPAAERLAEALARAAQAEIKTLRRPEKLDPTLDDLATYSLFGGGKVVVVLDTGLLAGKGHAAALLTEARAGAGGVGGTPLGGDELSGAGRAAALALLQAIRLFGIDPLAGSIEQVLESIPGEALSAGKRSAKAADAAREELGPLLQAARHAGLVGLGADTEGRLADLLSRGLPKGHHLVLVERSVDEAHPVARAIAAHHGLVELASVEAGRDGTWSGLADVAAELARESGVRIDDDALTELARRTLRPGDRRSADADATSTSRLAAEWRKLAGLATGGRISRELVERVVADRGEEDVWKVLDAIAEGRAAEAIARLRRRLESASDRTAERLSVFALLAGFCRQLVVIRGAFDLLGLRPERHYARFRDHVAPKLQGPLPAVSENPLAGLHPYRLHRASLAAAGIDRGIAAALPARVLEVELALKGESGDPEMALIAFVAELCGPPKAAAVRR